MSGIVYIVSAPSGSGKSTLTAEMLRIIPGLEFSISYTTRPPRGSERNGVEYFFVSKQEFERMIAGNEFLEHANVFGEYYGTSRHFVQAAAARGNDLLLDIDVQGAAQVKKNLPEAVSTFILPPSRDVLESRLRRRSQAEHVDKAVINRRLNSAGKEIENYGNYDYILVNDQLELSIDELKAIILSERLRRSGKLPSGEDENNVWERANRCRLEKVRSRVEKILASFSPVLPRNG